MISTGPPPTTSRKGAPRPGSGKKRDSLAWNAPAKLSRTPMEFGHYSNVGEDNDYVFREILGMPGSRIESLKDDGSLY